MFAFVELGSNNFRSEPLDSRVLLDVSAEYKEVLGVRVVDETALWWPVVDLLSHTLSGDMTRTSDFVERESDIRCCTMLTFSSHYCAGNGR